MPGEARAAAPDEAPNTRVRTVSLGLVPAPELPERIVEDIAGDLPEFLGRHVDDGVSWEVSVFCDPLTGDGRDAPEILDVCRDRAEREGWDFAVCLTDLPVYRDGQLIVADASVSRKVAGISLPALGVTRLPRRVRDAILQLVCELHAGNAGISDSRGNDGAASGGPSAKASWLPGDRPERLVSRRVTEFVVPIKRIAPPNEDMKEMDVDVRFVSPSARSHVRLLAGMVLANRPWKMFPSFKSVLAAAFATGAYVLVTPTIWQFGDTFGWPRLLALMIVSIAAMVVWLIVAHGLWERPDDGEATGNETLYNAATALTIAAAVILAYAALFALVLAAAAVFVEVDFLRSTLGHPVGPSDYLSLAWITTSLATVAGALGSGLEDEETVRRATYGYRQKRRYEESEESEEDSG